MGWCNELHKQKSQFVATRIATITVGSLFCLVFATVGLRMLHVGHAANLTGDINGDGVVNALDLSILLADWNQIGANLPADLNGDGSINTSDLSILLTHYGSVAPAGLAAIHVQGNQIVTDSGQTVRLRGADRGNGPEHYCISHNGVFNGPTDQASVSALQAWKINVVRIPLNEDCWLGINGAVTGGSAYQTPVINYVNLLNQNGIYAIVDLHVNAPGTQLATVLEPMADADHALAFWQSVAAAFKGNDRVIFDLFNEPSYKLSWSCWLDGGSAAACGTAYPIAGMQAMADTIRNKGAMNPLLIAVPGGIMHIPGWLTNKPTDPLNNLVLGFHAYGNNFNCDTSCLDTNVAPALQQVPILVGEVGESYDASLCTTTFLSSFTPWLESHGGHYAFWIWSTDTSSCGVNSLISGWDGTPFAPHGTWYHDYLQTAVP